MTYDGDKVEDDEGDTDTAHASATRVVSSHVLLSPLWLVGVVVGEVGGCG